MPCNFASRENLGIKRADESERELCGNQRIDNRRPLISQIAADCQIVSVEWRRQKRDRETLPRTNCGFTNHNHPILLSILLVIVRSKASFTPTITSNQTPVKTAYT